MRKIFSGIEKTLNHVKILHSVFIKESNFESQEKLDFMLYKQNSKKFSKAVKSLNLDKQLYSDKGRQMILADFIEYIFLGRGYYSLRSKKDKENFIRAILCFVNLLMCYEAITVSDDLRKKVLERLGKKISGIKNEEFYEELKRFEGTVGLKRGESSAPKQLNRYFDSLLPKTAGGLWHELLVYIFLLRNNFGYIIPLLLSQRLVGTEDNIIPPDFLIITHDRRICGIEVGTKKEIQSGSFSLETSIPTATIDTENSRCSDRCPICKKWIPFCEFVMKNYSNFDKDIEKVEIKCLEKCNLFSQDEIVSGECPYTKYRRTKAETLPHAQHQYANGLHYHYQCVLNNVSETIRRRIIEARDRTALKTHYPYYTGLEELGK